jgi:anti-anti-sigma factor
VLARCPALGLERDQVWLRSARGQVTPADLAESAAVRTRAASRRPAHGSASGCAAEISGMFAPTTLRPVSAAEPTVIAPEGELDISRSGDFRAALWEAAREGAADVLVDLSQVSFIDSSGLGALVELHNRLRRSKRRLAVVAPAGSAPAVLLDLAGLRGRVPTFETHRAALTGR